METNKLTAEEILLFDTSEILNDIEQIKQNIKAKVLPIFDENYWMLHYEMPEINYDLDDPPMQEIIKSLELTRKHYNAVGLSANQAGIPMRIFVIGTEDVNLTCINPRVIEYSGEYLKDSESCISFPGLHLKIQRPSWIKVQYTDQNGLEHENVLHGLTARCFLHELDHLNGKVFTKHVGEVSLNLARRKQKKLVRNIKKYL